jgi:hypothetical protein
MGIDAYYIDLWKEPPGLPYGRSSGPPNFVLPLSRGLVGSIIGRSPNCITDGDYLSWLFLFINVLLRILDNVKSRLEEWETSNWQLSSIATALLLLGESREVGGSYTWGIWRLLICDWLTKRSRKLVLRSLHPHPHVREHALESVERIISEGCRHWTGATATSNLPAPCTITQRKGWVITLHPASAPDVRRNFLIDVKSLLLIYLNSESRSSNVFCYFNI